MKKMNKKGFTLIELLAVIVVLAIIMVIATQQVNKTISGSRANAFIESYQMLVKQVKTYIASGETPACTGNCLSYYDLSDDYYLEITDDPTNSQYQIFFGAAGIESSTTTKPPTSGKKFANLDLTKYGNAQSNSSCKKEVIGSGATGCGKNWITGAVEY